MLHARSDYDSIQPFPTKRNHWVKIDGKTVEADGPDQVHLLGKKMEPIIPDDEPVFLIRAKDLNAPKAVQAWLELYIENGGADHTLIVGVERHIQLILAWQEQNASKVKNADVPKGVMR